MGRRVRRGVRRGVRRRVTRCDAATNCRLFCSVKQKAGTETLSVSILRSQTAQGEAHTCEQQAYLGPCHAGLGFEASVAYCCLAAW